MTPPNLTFGTPAWTATREKARQKDTLFVSIWEVNRCIAHQPLVLFASQDKEKQLQIQVGMMIDES